MALLACVTWIPVCIGSINDASGVSRMAAGWLKYAAMRRGCASRAGKEGLRPGAAWMPSFYYDVCTGWRVRMSFGKATNPGRAPSGSPYSGHPSAARARMRTARLAVARSAVRIRSKSPERQRRVVTNERSEIRNEGCRLCRPTVPQSGTVVTPSYALCHFGAGFSTFRAETHFSRGFHSFPMAHLSLFRWAIGGPRGPHISLSYGAQCHLWPTAIAARVTPGPRRFCRRGGGPSVAQWAARGPCV